MNRYRPLTLILMVGLLWLSLVPVARSQGGTPEKIESDDARVTPIGEWHTQASSNASGGDYLYNTPASVGAGLSPAQNPEQGASEPRPYETALSFNFAGSSIEVIYVAGPTLGTLAIEIDGTVLRTVITTAEKTAYGQASRIDYLADGPHELKVYAQEGGVVGVDAFITSPPNPLSTLVEGEQDGGIQATTCAPLNVTHRVSLNHLGAQAAGSSALPTISGDGRYVAFESHAGLVPSDGNGSLDVYVYDRQTCTIQLISVAANGGLAGGGSVNPTISANGRYVAFESTAPDLVAGDTNSLLDVFVYDRQTGTTTRASVDSGGGQATGGISFFPVISPDGRYIAFESAATNLVAGDSNGHLDIFVRDTQSALTIRVSISDGEAQAIGGGSENPSITPDGRYISFQSNATNLVTGDTNAQQDVFVRDTVANTTTRISVDSSGAQAVGGLSATSTLSANGRYVAFASEATNLVTGDTNGVTDIFLRDTQTNTTTRHSVDNSGTQAVGGVSVFSFISADGRYIAFRSGATNLVSGDTNAQQDIFVRDTVANTTTRVSVSSTGAQASTFSSDPGISADGRYVVYRSAATNLVPGDTNSLDDIFVAPRSLPTADTLALFNPAFNHVDLINTLADSPPLTAYTAFSAYAPVANGQWVMGDWNGDGLKTPGVYNNGPFFYTNKSGESQPADWQSLWIGIAGPPVSGRFNGALANDCIGAVQTASLGGSTVFVLYFTCDLSGTTLPAISNQWLSAVLPDAGGFSGTHQFKSGDFNSDGVDSIAVRRGTFIAFGNVAPATGPATFDLAQFIGTPATTDAGSFVVGDWDASGADSFGLFYQNGEFFYRNDLTFNSGVYVNQSVGQPFAGTVQATTWR